MKEGPYRIISGGRRPKMTKKRHRCKLPGFFTTFRMQAYTIIECFCGKQWILAWTASMVDDSRCWQRYDGNEEYWRKALTLLPGE